MIKNRYCDARDCILKSSTLLSICKKDILPIDISTNLISVMRNDAYYNIRHAANC